MKETESSVKAVPQVGRREGRKGLEEKALKRF
jgi:hypothetical protein